MTRYSILKPGYNCWRVEHARRVSFLIDAAAYYKAFRASAARSHHSILMLGWDIDSRVKLVRDETPGNYRTRCAIISTPSRRATAVRMRTS